MKMNFLNSRRFKYGSLATGITVGVIVALILLNAVMGFVSNKYPLSMDLTSNKLYQLDAQSINYLKRLNQNVKITVCSSESSYRSADKQAYEVLMNYPKYSKRVTVSFVDLDKNPTFSQQHSELSLAENDILFVGDKQQKKIASNDMVSQSTDQATGETQSQSTAEQSITAAILYVTDANPVTVSVMNADSKVDLSGYISLLKSNNYNVETQKLLTEKVDPAASFAILAQPSADLTQEQAKHLSDYLDNDGKFGKGLIFVASAQDVVGPVLKNFLADWGISVGDEIVYETNSSYQLGNAFAYLSEITDDTIKGATQGSSSRPLAVAYAKPVNALFTSKDNRTVDVVAKTSESTILVPKNADAKFDVAKQKKQSFNTVVMANKVKSSGDQSVKSYVVVLGSQVMVSSDVLQEGSYINGNFMTALSNTIAQKKDTFQIVPKDLSTVKVNATTQQQVLCVLFLVVLIPIALIVCGIVVWVRRRHA